MQINKLRTKNFKSIYGEFELNFEQTKGLWKIEGPVGSGKTTIGEAILYGLFGTIRAKNNDSLISWGTKKGQIELWMTSNGHEIYIRREINSYGQSPIYAEVDGEELVFTNKRDAQSILENEYYDAPRLALEMLCIISFNNFKSLTSLSTKDTKLFMNKVLGFEIFDRYGDICKQHSTECATEILRIEAEIEDHNKRIKDIETHKQLIVEGSIPEVETEITQINKVRKDKKDVYSANLTKLNADLKTLETHMVSLTATGKIINNDIDLMKRGKCPTCGAAIDQSLMEDRKRALADLRADYKKERGQADDLQKKIDALKAEYLQIDRALSVQLEELSKKKIQLHTQSLYSSHDKKNIKNIKNEIGALRKKLINVQSEQSQWYALFTTIVVDARKKCLNQFIPILNQHIREHVQRLHLPYIVRFDSELNCTIVHSIQNIEIPISSLSTGQLKTLDMSVILGVLSSLLGTAGTNILFLDELFSNLDEGLRNEVIEILKQTINPDHTTFIISHTPMNEQLFDGTIQVRLLGSEVRSTSNYEIIGKNSVKVDIKY